MRCPICRCRFSRGGERRRREADPEFDAILKECGSEEAVYKFLTEQFDEINQKVFEGRLSVPSFQIKPMWLSKSLMGEENSGADYQPKEGHRLARIGMFTPILLDRDTARRVLAHEMIHHWEHTIAQDDESTEYPRAIDKKIRDRFKESKREGSWRSRRCQGLISKAYRAARTLDTPPEKLL